MTVQHKNHKWSQITQDEIGWCDDKQELTINLSKQVGEPMHLTLTSWQNNNGISWKTLIDGKIEQHSNPFETPPFPFNFLESGLLQYWREQIPGKLMLQLRRFKGNAFGILNLCSRYQYADELFNNHPTLFWLTFMYIQKHSKEEAEFIELCRLKQTEILKSINLPAKKPALKLLHKIKARHYAQNEYDLIRSLLRLNIERLNHLETVPIPLIELILHFPKLLNSKLLNRWNDKGIKHLRESIQDIEHMSRRIGLDSNATNQQLYGCKNMIQLEELHDKLVKQFDKAMADITSRKKEVSAVPLWIPFPPPPLLGNENIVPISDRKTLFEEGRQQRHCVAVYDEDIIKGQYYVYQVLRPERATLGIVIKKKQSHSLQQNVSIDQLKGYHNKTVSQATKAIVLDWFNDKNNINCKGNT